MTITNRGKPLVRIEPVREAKGRRGYGSMKGTVEFLVPDEEIVSAGHEGWGVIQEWDQVDGS